jgi:hypothetical protein
MKPELAQRLKTAGFPQGGESSDITFNHIDDSGNPCSAFGSNAVYIPSVGELIEELGDSFYAVIRGGGRREGEWYASNMTSPEFAIDKAAKGTSALEALAELYIAIHTDAK